MTNNIPVFATAYFPPIIYFAYLQQFTNIQIEQFETFPKQTYRNRALILSANGILPLSVPVIRTKGNHTLTREMKISYQENWNVRHWRAIEAAYNASPYFLYYKDNIEKILMQRYEHLLDLNQALLQVLLKHLKITCQVTLTDDFAPDEKKESDFRYSITLKKNISPTLFPTYCQVFDSRMEFQPNMCILDLLFNVGPDAKSYLRSIVSRGTNN